MRGVRVRSSIARPALGPRQNALASTPSETGFGFGFGFAGFGFGKCHNRGKSLKPSNHQGLRLLIGWDHHMVSLVTRGFAGERRQQGSRQGEGASALVVHSSATSVLRRPGLGRGSVFVDLPRRGLPGVMGFARSGATWQTLSSSVSGLAGPGSPACGPRRAVRRPPVTRVRRPPGGASSTREWPSAWIPGLGPSSGAWLDGLPRPSSRRGVCRRAPI
jgi:hypothetical protein